MNDFLGSFPQNSPEQEVKESSGAALLDSPRQFLSIIGIGHVKPHYDTSELSITPLRRLMLRDRRRCKRELCYEMCPRYSKKGPI